MAHPALEAAAKTAPASQLLHQVLHPEQTHALALPPAHHVLPASAKERCLVATRMSSTAALVASGVTLVAQATSHVQQAHCTLLPLAIATGHGMWCVTAGLSGPRVSAAVWGMLWPAMPQG